MTTDILHVETREDATLIRLLASQVYQDVVPGFREYVLRLLDEGHRRIIFDLSKVDVMNSSGLGILILIQDRLDKSEGSMVLSGLSPVMRQLFSQMKLETLFNVAENEREALKLLKEI